MPEYIERDLVISKIEERAMLRCHAHDAVTYKHLKLVKWDIADLPAADVAPVRHGRWVKAKGRWVTPGGDPVWECSECGKGKHVYGIEHGTYGKDVADGQWVSCPNCGANMMDMEDGNG